ncbi:MAG: hypothetical protein K8S27_03335 [Candidatus Omnitrophica bacterium]|nr:hypothetical protein [Candidatus Omnitrophota bacterium]
MTDAHFYNNINPIFTNLPDFDQVEYLGTFNEHILSFKGTRGEQEEYVLVSHMINADEASIWETTKEMFQQALERAKAYVHGRFGYELISFEMDKGLTLFQDKEFITLIKNHAAKLKEGQTRPFKYCSIYGHLIKYTDEHWGDILFKTHIQTYRRSVARIDLTFKSLFTIRKNFQDKLTYIFLNDLSQRPIYNKDLQEQKDRVAKQIRKIKTDPLGPLTQINVLANQERHIILDKNEDTTANQMSFWD